MFDSHRPRSKRHSGGLSSRRQRARQRRRLTVEPLEDRRLLATLPLVDLADGGAADDDGFVLDSTLTQDLTGFSVSHAGDVNQDGFDDLVVGAPVDPFLTDTTPGSAYIVYGKADGFADLTLNANLDAVDGQRLLGIANTDRAGFSVSAAGDVNADGFHDFVIGAPYSDSDSFFGTGQAYLVFGNSEGLPTSLGSLDGSNGFLMQGLLGFDRAGFSVNTAGDINGDGYDDLVVGAPSDDAEATTGLGIAYVVYGKADGFDAQVNLWELAGPSGFALTGLALDDHLGSAVSTVGDVNGDGFSDFAVTSPYADPNGVGTGSAYVIFGGTQPALGVNVLDGTNGFRLDGFIPFERAGFSVSSAGDFNGDGFDDVFVGAPGDRNDPWDPTDYANPAGAGRGYVVYGKAEAFAPAINLGNIDVAGDGFSITGIDGFDLDGGVDYAGFSVSSAGDVDGDGFDDLILGAPFVDDGATVGVGEAYLIFGRAAGFPGGLGLSTLTDDQGTQLLGGQRYDRAGYSVSSAGDVNGDGFADVAIGAPSDFPLTGRAGKTFVLFGQDFRGNGSVVGDELDNDLVGDATANSLVGGQANDTLAGGGGADVLLGGQGDDTAFVSDLLFRRVDGGRGTDTLSLVGSGLTLDLAAIPDNRIRGIERVDLSGDGSNSLVVGTLQEILNLSDTSNRVTVLRDIDDSVDIGSGWTEIAPQVVDDVTFRVYEQGAATLLVQEAAPELDLNGPDDAGIDFAAAYQEDAAPVAIVDADLTVVEDGVLTSATATLTNVLDGSDESLAVTVGDTGLQASYDTTSGVLALSGAASPAAYEEVLRTLVYANASQSPDTTDRLIEVSVADGIFTSTVATSTVTVEALNDAPAIANFPGLLVTVIDEDTTDPAGSTLESIIPANKITDADGSSTESVAVINVDNTNGTWQYRIADDWVDFGTPTESDARLLVSNSEFRFIPNPDFFGVTTMKVRAWDQTTGSVGGVADVVTNGGTTAFSSELATVTLNVTPINDAPQLDSAASPTLPPISEDETNSAGAQVANIVPDGSIIDADGSAVEAIAVVSVDDANGHWEHSANGTDWSTLTASTTSALLLGPAHWVRFIPNANYHGMASFEFHAWDQTDGDAGTVADVSITGGTTAFSDTSDLATITVQPIDDPPTLDPIDEINLLGGVVTHTVTLSGISDGDEGTETLAIAAAFSNPELVESAVVTYNSPDPTGSIELTFIADQHGQATITATVTEDDGQTVSQTFSVTVSDPDRLWQNPNEALDIDNNTFVVPLDALLIINALNARDFINELNKLPPPPVDGAPPPYLDPSGDGFMTALDVLLVINFLNDNTPGVQEGEGESVAAANVSIVITDYNDPPRSLLSAVRSTSPDTVDAVPVDTSNHIVARPVESRQHRAERDRLFADYDADNGDLMLELLPDPLAPK